MVQISYKIFVPTKKSRTFYDKRKLKTIFLLLYILKTRHLDKATNLAKAKYVSI